MIVKPSECYFAIDIDSNEEILVAICSKNYWDEYGELDSDFELDCSNLDFLDQVLDNMYCCIEDYTFDEIKLKLEESGMEYSEEIQTFLNEIKNLSENEYEENSDISDEDFWLGT